MALGRELRSLHADMAASRETKATHDALLAGECDAVLNDETQITLDTLDDCANLHAVLEIRLLPFKFLLITRANDTVSMPFSAVAATSHEAVHGGTPPGASEVGPHVNEATSEVSIFIKVHG